MYGVWLMLAVPPVSCKLHALSMNYFVEVINSGTGLGVFRERDATELALVAWTSIHGLATLPIAGSLDAEPRITEQLSELVRGISRNIFYGISK